jgi:lysophospholipase L1-like esterase
MRSKQTISGVMFDASAGTLDFSAAVSGFAIERLFAVLNGPTLIYAVATPGAGYSAIAGNLITLEFDTAAMADSDPLTVIYDQDVVASLPSGAATSAKQDALVDLIGDRSAIPTAYTVNARLGTLNDAIGSATGAAATDTGPSTVIGFLRYLRDKLVSGLVLGAGTALVGKFQRVNGANVIAPAGTATDPVYVDGGAALRDFHWILASESREIQQTINNMGSQAQVLEGNTNNVNWRTATPSPATEVLGTWHRLMSAGIVPVAGRAILLRSITVELTAAAEIQILKFKNFANELYSLTGLTALVGLNATYSGTVDSTSLKYTFDFPDGLLVRGGERIDLFYAVAGSTGSTGARPNWQVSYTGYDITDDFDYGVEKTILIISDSIGSTADTSALKYQTIGGVVTNCMWPFGVKANCLAANKPTRIVNLSIPGSDAAMWAWLCAQGKIDAIKADAIIINLGMNDSASSTQLSSAAGAANDGNFKKALKVIISAYRRRNPSGKVVLNNITATDESSRVATVSGNALYNGQTRLAAYRAEIAAVAADLAATLGTAIQVSATDTAYSAATGTPYIAANQSAGARIHPNDTVGQPAMVTPIWNALVAAGYTA